MQTTHHTKKHPVSRHRHTAYAAKPPVHHARAQHAPHHAVYTHHTTHHYTAPTHHHYANTHFDNNDFGIPATPHYEYDHGPGPVAARAAYEDKLATKYFSVMTYKPTYILPYYYTGAPANAAYAGTTPNNETLKHNEVKYQFSFKVPVWKDIHDYPVSLDFAYTQLSYWQLYNTRAFVRETDYEPEIFVETEVKWRLSDNWRVNFMNVGLDHQSNGEGNSLERSWNRAYLEAIASNDHWMVSLKPWYVISVNGKNSSITKYLGYGRILVSCNYSEHVVSLAAHNLIEGYARRATAELTYSFPVSRYIKGYVQVFSGYGQSLIEYNKRTNSAGIGVAFSDYL